MRRVGVLIALIATSILILSAQQDSVSPVDQDQPDQPGQAVARLSVINGDASVRRGDSGDWVAAALNAPLMAGDSVSVSPGGSAELQLDNANFVRIAGDSEIRIAALENGRNQIQVAKGLITYRVLRPSNAQSEISSPSVAVHPLRVAAVRVEVSPDGSTRVTVRRGDVEASTPRGTERIREGNTMIVRGSADDPEYQVASAPSRDSWDNWNDQRDSYLERAQSNRYVSQDISGAEDLDAYGRWGYDPAYGNVWTPSVAASWAPYRNGQWVWEDYYGWTWVDYAPWGWAPFHYGSWYFRTGYGWSWFPGSRYGHYWWRPAMVGFFGLGGGLGFGNIGWIPLAPYEAFHPWYGRGGWGGGRYGFVNNVHNTNVVNVYRNARFGNGVTAVSSQDFQRGAFRNRIEVNRGDLERASLVRGAVPVTPTANNLRFSERPGSTVTPRSDIGNRRFFSRMPAATQSSSRVPFAQQQAAVRSTFGEGSRQVPANTTEANTTAPRPRGDSRAPGGQTYGGQPGGSGWRRFGEPNQPAGQMAEPQRNTPGARWDGFGSPQSVAPRRFNPPPQQQTEQRQGQGQVETPYSRRPDYNSRGNSTYQGNSGPSRSLQVAPPIVRQREAPSRFENRGGGGGENYRSAPAPSYRSAPTPSYRSAPAPSYRSAPAPSYRSAPAPTNRGGGGGGGGNAGHGNSGGHGGGRR
jgi:hypothetical protein